MPLATNKQTLKCSAVSGEKGVKSCYGGIQWLLSISPFFNYSDFESGAYILCYLLQVLADARVSKTF